MPEIVFDHYDDRDECRREALFSLGNGVLSWRASAPEAAFNSASAEHYGGLYRAGWYDNAQRLVNGSSVRIDSLINLPDPFGLSFSADSEQRFEGQANSYRQCLDLETSIVRRDLQLRLGSNRFELKEQRFVSLADPTLAILRWEIQSDTALNQFVVHSLLDGNTTNRLIERDLAYQGKRLEVKAVIHHDDGFAAMLACLPGAGERIAVACQLVTHPCLRWSATEQRNRLTQQACWPPGHSRWIIEKRVRVLLNDEIPQPLAAIEQLMPKVDYAVLRAEHEQRWKAIWADTAVRLNDPSLSTPLRLGMWHVLQSSPLAQDNADQGFPPRGWQEGYFAQIFWDEMFAFPFLASRFKNVSEQLLDYRYRRLDAAKRNAVQAGFQGAMFPWRSARDGTEQTPPFRLNPLSGRWMKDPTCLQRHIGSAIVYDVWQHFQMTADVDWLARVGAELMIEVARFWASVVTEDPVTARYMIHGVIGPDEYHNGYPGSSQPGLDNNAYTNTMAAWVLLQTNRMLEHLPNLERANLMQRLDVDGAEPETWSRIAQRMYLPFLTDGVLNQFDGYEQLLDSPPDWNKGSDPRLDWLLEAHHDSSDHYQLTKQADVLTLFYLFTAPELQRLCEAMGYPFNKTAMQRTVAFHLTRITHESSLSKVICAGALAHLQPETSWKSFCDCLRTDLDAPPVSGTVEGVHLAAMGGAVDVLQRHYLGIYPTPDALHLCPSVPAALDGVTMGFCFHGQKMQVSLQSHRLTLKLASNANPVDICCDSRRFTLFPGESLPFDCLENSDHEQQ